MYLREFDYVTVRTMFDIIHVKEAKSVALETVLEMMILLNYQNEITKKSNFEVKLLGDIIKVRFTRINILKFINYK